MKPGELRLMPQGYFWKSDGTPVEVFEPVVVLVISLGADLLEDRFCTVLYNGAVLTALRDWLDPT